MAKVQIDTKKLHDIIIICFDNAGDDRFSRADQKEFLALGKRLRGTLVNILSAYFDDENKAFIEATKKLNSVNREVKATIKQIGDTAKTLENIGKLVGVLDDLLITATKFI